MLFFVIFIAQHLITIVDDNHIDSANLMTIKLLAPQRGFDASSYRIASYPPTSTIYVTGSHLGAGRSNDENLSGVIPSSKKVLSVVNGEILHESSYEESVLLAMQVIISLYFKLPPMILFDRTQLLNETFLMFTPVH